MQNATHWKNGIDDLRARAVEVMAAPARRCNHLQANETAACLAGVVSYVQRTHSLDEAQRACAELVRHDLAWATSFGSLPAERDGRVTEPVLLLAVVCRGLLEVAGAANLRAALSFWATETDPAVWSRLFA